MWTAKFWKDLAERALTTFAEALGAFLIVVEGGLLDVDWSQGLAVAGLAALIAVLKGIVGTRFGDPESPAWLPAGE